MEKYKVGEDVVYNNHRWTIESIERDKMYGINPGTGERIVEVGVRYRLARLRRTPSCVFELVWTMAPEEQIENVPHELTAKEYAEKLKEYFGWIEGDALEYKPCKNKACSECVFNRSGIACQATLYTIDPEKALEMIREQEEKNKPKGKTYLEDIRERLPNVFINKFGIPEGCRKRLCNGIACTDCMPGMEECRKCWNEVMPEEDNGKGRGNLQEGARGDVPVSRQLP